MIFIYSMQGKEYNGSFSFDKVYGMDTAQKDIFDYSVKSIVDGNVKRPRGWWWWCGVGRITAWVAVTLNGWAGSLAELHAC